MNDSLTVSICGLCNFFIAFFLFTSLVVQCVYHLCCKMSLELNI